MILIDANHLLVYSLHSDMPRHEAARAWLEDCLNGKETIGLSWSVILAVLRLTTNERLFPSALPVEQALAVVEGWLQHPLVVLISPGPDHWHTLATLLRDAGMGGNLTPDAHLAALAMEHGGTVYSCDADFRRFPGLRFRNPLC
ncbi:MAG: TA system VapC family ribonuclease toxin [Cyanobium sp.]